jgi:hypothetical protein
VNSDAVQRGGSDARKIRGMRLGFASLLLWITWLLVINLLSRFGGKAVWLAVALLTAFPLACATCVVLAIVAVFWHSKWWSLSVLVAAFICYEFVFGIRSAGI